MSFSSEFGILEQIKMRIEPYAMKINKKLNNVLFIITSGDTRW
jgi:hypothetical protein